MSAARRTLLVATVAALAPALVCLAWTIGLSPSTPEPEGWRLSRGDEGLQFTWFYFEHGPDPSRLLLFRLVYLGLLHLPGSDFGRFGVLNWVLALGTVGAVLALARRASAEHGGPVHVGPVHVGPVHVGRVPVGPGLIGPVLIGIWAVLLSAWAFSPGFGADWLLGARFGLFFPPLALVLCVLLLRGGSGVWRVVLAALLASAAPFFDRSGVLVWMCSIPLLLAGAPPERRTTRVVFWVILGNVVTAASFGSPWAEDGVRSAGIARHVLDAPWSALRAVLGAVGDTVPRVVPAFAGERVVAGAVLLAVLLVLGWRALSSRAGERSRRRALPWAVLAAFGVGNALVLSDEHIAHALGAQTWRELGWGGWLLPVGLLGLAAVSLGRRSRSLLVAGTVAALLLLLQDWHRGWEHLKVQRALLHQAGAQLVFAGALGDRLPAEDGPAILDPEVAQVLRDRGRLHGVEQVVSDELSELRVEPALSGLGEIEGVEGEIVRGAVHATTFRFAPDLVLVTRRRPESEADGDERILRIAAPAFATGGKHFAWTADLAGELTPGEEVRAYGFTLRGRRAIPLAGRLRRTDSGLVREDGP